MTVLVTAPTNKAVCVLATRFVEEMQKYSKNADLSTILLVGNPDRLEIDENSLLSQISLDYRSKILKETKGKLNELIPELYHLLYKGRVTSSSEETLFSPDNFREAVKISFKEIQNVLKILRVQSLCDSKNDMENDCDKMIQRVEILLQFSDRVLNFHYAKQIRNTSENQESKESIDLAAAVGSLTRVIRRLRNYWSRPENDKSTIEAAIIVFSTVSTAASRSLQGKLFNVCIVDEASQLVEAHTAMVLNHGLDCLILAGDHLQLPATVISQKASKNGYGVSLFERLILRNFPNFLLDTQYRMHPSILEFPNNQFYGGKIKNADNVCQETFRREWSEKYSQVVLIDASMGREECDVFNSKFNAYEAAVCRSLVNDFRKLHNQSVSIGIISPYKAQVRTLQKLLNYSNNDTDGECCFIVSPMTVDGCQGQEYDVVIFSAVRANNEGKVGFLSDVRRLNVAITRPRHTLIILCDEKTVSNNKNWRMLIESAKARGAFLSSSDALVKEMSKQYIRERGKVDHLSNDFSCILFEDCLWGKVMSFTNEFKSAFANCTSKRHIIPALIRLANGNWPKRELNTSLISRHLAGVIHFYDTVNDFRIIWSVDVMHSKDNVAVKQELKLWDLVSSQSNGSEHGNALKALKRIESCFRLYSPQYLEKCRFTKVVEGKTLPANFSVDRDFVWYCDSSQIVATAQASGVDDIDMVQNKFYPLSSKNVRIMLNSKNANFDLPFKLSLEEKEIMDHAFSTIILGRSGCGKTTVMLHRMLSEALAVGDSTPRSIFITASSILCGAIKQSYQNMIKPLKPADVNGIAEISDSTSITNSSMLKIPDAAFPLIITYDDLLRILQSTIGINEFADNFSMRIDYILFENVYYNHFPEKIIKAVDASVIFTEIRSCIKGSITALKSDLGHLTLQEYLKLAESRTSELNESIRILIYEAFEKYEKKRKERKEYDMEDVVYRIYRSLSQTQICEDKLFTGIYVDEVQDFSPSQLALLKFACGNVTNFHFAGDPAQTVSRNLLFKRLWL